MKKNYLLLVAVGTMMLAACSNNEDVVQPDMKSDGPSITLSINSEAIITKAARPVESSEATNNVNKVKLVTYDGTTGDLIANADFFDASVPAELAWTAASGASQNVKLKAGLADGNYTIIAYGYNGYFSTNYKSIVPPSSITLPVTDAGIKTALTVTLGTGGAYETLADRVAEVFAGYLNITVADGNITSSNNLTMWRQVAGALGYFTNVPVLKRDPANPTAALPVKFVRVIASSSNPGFTIPDVTTPAGVNGTGTPTAKAKVLEINLSALTSSTGDYATQVAAAQALFATDETGALATTFASDAKTEAIDGIATLANSFLTGKFVIPFAKVSGVPTLKVQLVGVDASSAEVVLQEWNVKTLMENGTAVTTSTNNFDIVRNSFYSIGQKLKANTTEGEDTGTTDDDDSAIDLSQSATVTDIALTMNDAWSNLCQLGVE